jgi:hypothetical protein
LAAALPARAYDWLQFNGNAEHSGNNSHETLLDRGNVAALTLKYQVTLPAIADGAPVLLQGVSTPGGVKDLLFLTTTAGHILALDAGNGSAAWSRQFGAGTCKINNGSNACFTTSSPAIDPNRLFVYTYGLDGYVHKLQVADGTEVVTGGWPELATTKGFDEKGSSALAVATSNGRTYLYVAHGGYPGDNGDYQGHITAIDLATGTQNVFNAMCSEQAAHFVHSPASPDCPAVRSAIWSRPGVIYDAGTDRIYLSTGNGDFDAARSYWGDSILALKPDGTGSGGRPLDSYTPTNEASLDASDADLGSSAPAILPVPANAIVQHLAVQGGKDGKLRLLNLANLSGQNGPGRVGGEVAVMNVPQGGVVLTQPSVWVNPADASTWVFVVNGSGASALRLAFDAGGHPSLVLQWQNGLGGSSPIVANNVLYDVSGGTIRAVDPTSGALLWSSSSIGSIHWQSPIIANGTVYVTDGSSQLSAFSVPGLVPPPPGASTNYEGLWWNAPPGSEAGWGINFAHQGSVIFATWFTYDFAGSNWWLSMVANALADNLYVGNLYVTNGPAFNAVPFDPAQVTATSVGEGTLSFSDANNATFTYEIGGLAQTKHITREVFGPMPSCVWGAQPNLASATNYQDLWWAAPAGLESGWGVNLTQQGATIFGTWFTYDANHHPLWLAVAAARTAPNNYAGTLYLTRGPAFNAVPFDSTQVMRRPVGTATFSFSDGNNGTFAYDVDLGDGVNKANQTKAITRQVFRAPGTVCQ